MDDCRARLKPTTCANKEHLIRTKLVPYFGDLPLCNIDTATVRRWQNEIITSDENYAPTYQKVMHNQLSAILNYAVKYYGLSFNAAARCGSIGKKNADKMDFWTIDEFKTFISVVDNPISHTIFNLLFYSGMREGEMLRILEIFSLAKDFMHKNGNPNQWNGAYPDEQTLLCDIEKGHLFVMTEPCGRIYACFALIGGNDPTYEKIDGAWRSKKPYGTIHRIAGDGTRNGVFRECFEFARGKYNHLRVDTHEDNKPMQNAVLKCGFEYAGIIHLADSSPRLAFDWLETE